jgi:polyisoprenoid-binding protein YceI
MVNTMKKTIFTIVSIALMAFGAQAQLFSTAVGNLSFFSKTPVENIEAQSTQMLSVLNIKTKELAFSVVNTSFKFPNKLMEEHFNEKYMESEKYPNSTFKGKINEDVDLTKDGEYKVTVTGKLNIHGVEQDRTIPGTIIVKDGVILLMAMFKVKEADHKIEIPKLVIAKIAEELDVKVEAKLMPRK